MMVFVCMMFSSLETGKKFMLVYACCFSELKILKKSSLHDYFLVG